VGLNPPQQTVPCRSGHAGTLLDLEANPYPIPRVTTVHMVARNAIGHSSRLAHAVITELGRGAATGATPATNGRWSGYVATGGPFVGVSGTFSVPNLAAARHQSNATEWVGIDGADNRYLIQAGVQQDYDPATGRVGHYAWWESLPDHPTQLAIPLRVLPGDRITVVIGRTGSPSGTWWISVVNETTGQTFNTEQLYAGPGTSAEWVVEAPSTRGLQDTLGRYSPPVAFTSLGIDGRLGPLSRNVIEQNGGAVSTPSALTNGGFTVAYGAVPPPPRPRRSATGTRAPA
jgi:hypothetical protein